MDFTKSKETYIKEIFRLSQQYDSVRQTDIARRMRVTRASVNRAVKTLAKEGYVNHAPYEHVSLTPLGLKKGVDLCQRQEIITAYLMHSLSIDRQTAFEEACRLEHVISPKIVDSMKERLSGSIGNQRI